MVTISLLARKGGVGRTTTTLNLAGAFAKDGLSVLCIDMDSQASLSRTFLGSDAVERSHPANTVTGLFSTRFDPEPEDVIHDTKFDAIGIVPACDALEDYNDPHPSETGEAQYAISKFLNEVRDRYQIVLIDTGPNTCGLLAWASLAASNFVLSPTLADAYGTQSIISVQRLVEKVQTRVNAELEILGYFVNMRQRNTVNEAYERTLRKLHGSQVFETVVPHAVAYRESAATRKPLTIAKPRVKASKIIGALAAEIGQRIISLSSNKEAA